MIYPRLLCVSVCVRTMMMMCCVNHWHGKTTKIPPPPFPPQTVDFSRVEGFRAFLFQFSVSLFISFLFQGFFFFFFSAFPNFLNYFSCPMILSE